jgi:hypothetical protein
MISRREVVTAGMLGTLATTSSAEGAALQGADELRILREGLKAIEDRLMELRSSVDQGLRGSSMNFGLMGQLKQSIEKFARASGKFPEYCDVGLGVFYEVYDWHLRHNQQIQIARVSDQRIMILFMFTQLIVRWENESSYIGVPY